MRLFIAITTATLFLFSCKKDKDANMAYSNDTGIRISFYKTEGTEVKITYDDNNQVSSISTEVRQPGIGPVPMVNITTATTNFIYDNNLPTAASSQITMMPFDITLNTKTLFTWDPKGALLETSRDNEYKTTWSADATGRPTGHSSISTPAIKWSYNNNGDVAQLADDRNGYTSTLTYTSHKNPFNNGRLGLLTYMNGQHGDVEAIIRYFSAHLPEKWETSSSHTMNDLNGAIIQNKYINTISYGYEFDATGLLTGIQETRKSQSYRNNELISASETKIFFPITCYRVK